MTLEEAINQACSRVGIVPPQGRIDMRRWIKANTTGKNGSGDGRLICDDFRVTAHNWQTGESITVWLNEQRSPEEKRRFAKQRQEDERKARDRSDNAAAIAQRIVSAAKADHHAYLARKGFPDERPLVLDAKTIAEIGGRYLAPEGGGDAIVVPARIGERITSVQLIWESGAKKFLFGGDMSGAAHRIATGSATWLCEGFATGLSLRAALRALNRRDTVLVCFSASNIVKVAAQVQGRRYIAADHDAPPAANPDQFGGIGAGKYFARKSGQPFLMPPIEGTDINDLQQAEGIFAVQRLVTGLLREVGP